MVHSVKVLDTVYTFGKVGVVEVDVDLGKSWIVFSRIIRVLVEVQVCQSVSVLLLFPELAPFGIFVVKELLNLVFSFSFNAVVEVLDVNHFTWSQLIDFFNSTLRYLGFDLGLRDLHWRHCVWCRKPLLVLDLDFDILPLLLPPLVVLVLNGACYSVDLQKIPVGFVDRVSAGPEHITVSLLPVEVLQSLRLKLSILFFKLVNLSLLSFDLLGLFPPEHLWLLELVQKLSVLDVL